MAYKLVKELANLSQTVFALSTNEERCKTFFALSTNEERCKSESCNERDELFYLLIMICNNTLQRTTEYS